MEQRKHPEANTVIRVLEGTKCVDDIAKSMLAPVKQLLKVHTTKFSSSCLVSSADTIKYLVTCHFRMKVLEQCYDSVIGGHLSFIKILGKVSQQFFWPDMRADIDN